MNITKYIQEFRNEMEFKRYSKNSIDLYESVIYNFLKFFENEYVSPDRIPTEKIKKWLKNSPSYSTIKIRIGALKNFYKRVVNQPLKFNYIEYPRHEHKQPIILSTEEIQRLFSVCENVKHYCIMLVAYSTGVRVSELLDIRLKDIDRANGVIHVINGKGAKQRIVTMKQELLNYIIKYYRQYKPKEFLFEGQFGGKYTSSSINQFLKKYGKLANIKKNIHIHLLRHQYATDCLNNDVNLYITQKALGHSNPKTTADFYYHLSPKIIANTYSPINNIKIQTL